jgi:molybdate transport system substrate-binding protein
MRGWLAIACAAGLSLAAPASQGRELLVFAAASLSDALEEIVARSGMPEVRTSYASSSTLARQIELGAPADVFISAHPVWMDYLARKGLIDGETRVDLLGNRLVLIAPRSSAVQIEIRRGFPLAKQIGEGFLAMGDPEHVPAGIYARAALESLGVWSLVEHRITRSESVRAALALVSRGESPLGIVYGSDAVAEPAVRVLGEFPPRTHPLIHYPVACVEGHEHFASDSFLSYLRSPQAKAIFRRYGFETAL